MSKKQERPEVTKAMDAHRAALETARRAVGEWAKEHSGARDGIAGAMLVRLSECANDKTGDKTAEVVSELFDEHVELLDADRANAVAHALGRLGQAGQALGHRRSMRLEDR